MPKVGFDKLIPAFNATAAGSGVFFSQSYGASGDQSRNVEAGLQTDIVLFSLEPDITRLVKAGLIDANWKDGEFRGVPASSVVTLVVRSGAGLAFVRAIGEFGSVVLIGGGIPRDTQVASQYIAQQIEVDRPVNAAAVSMVLLAISFAILLVLRVLGSRAAHRH